jgi:hypothetical protein
MTMSNCPISEEGAVKSGKATVPVPACGLVAQLGNLLSGFCGLNGPEEG